MSYLEDAMRQISDFQRKHMGINCQRQWACFEEFVLKFGVYYEWETRPKNFKQGIIKQCFSNSSLLARKHENLVYVEGFASGQKVPLPVHHAWVVRRGSNKVIDVTTEYFDTYIGVPFDTKFLKKHWRSKPKSSSLIDNWEDGFPLLKMNEAEIRGIMEK